MEQVLQLTLHSATNIIVILYYYTIARKRNCFHITQFITHLSLSNAA